MFTWKCQEVFELFLQICPFIPPNPSMAMRSPPSSPVFPPQNDYTSLKLPSPFPALATLDLTKTGNLCLADSILPRKREHRHSQSSLAMPVFFWCFHVRENEWWRWGESNSRLRARSGSALRATGTHSLPTRSTPSISIQKQKAPAWGAFCFWWR